MSIFRELLGGEFRRCFCVLAQGEQSERSSCASGGWKKNKNKKTKNRAGCMDEENKKRKREMENADGLCL